MVMYCVGMAEQKYVNMSFTKEAREAVRSLARTLSFRLKRSVTLSEAVIFADRTVTALQFEESYKLQGGDGE